MPPPYKLSKPSWMPLNTYLMAVKGRCEITIACKGCRKTFGCKKNKNGALRPHLHYYFHCIELCREGKKLARECVKCGYKFVSASALLHHEKRVHSDDSFRRDWMDNRTLFRSSMSGSYKYKIACKGCRQQFPARKKYKDETGDRLRPRVDFIIHCIEKCKKFQALG